MRWPRRFLLLALLLLNSDSFAAVNYPFGGSAAIAPSTTATRLASPMGGITSAWETTTANVYGVMPINITVTEIKVYWRVAPGGTASQKLTLRNNTSATAATCTVTGATQACTSGTIAVDFNQGDLPNIQSDPTTGVGAPSASTVTWLIYYTPDTPGETILGMSNTAGVGIPAGTNYGGFTAVGNFAAANARYNPIAGASTIKNLCVRLNVTPGSMTSRTFTLNKEVASPQAVTVAFDEDDVGVECDNVNTYAASVGDVITLESTMTGSPAASIAAWGIAEVQAVAGNFSIIGRVGTSATLTVYAPLFGFPTSTEATNETIVNTLGAANFQIIGSYIKFTGAAGAAPNAYGLVLRANAGDAPQTFAVTIAGTTQTTACTNVGGTGGCSDVTALTLADAGLYDTQIIPTDSPTTATAMITYLGNVPSAGGVPNGLLSLGVGR